MFQIPMKANLLSFNFSKERISLFIIFAYCYLLYSFFFLLFLLPCNFCLWRPLRNFCHAHGLCPYLLSRSPFWVFNLAGSFCLNFFLGHLSSFQPSYLFFLFFSNVVSSESIHVDWAKNLFPIQICNSRSTS